MGKLSKILLFINKLSSRNLTRPALLIRLAIALVGFTILVFVARVWISRQPVRSISISGTKLISSEEIRSSINDSLLINVPKNAINMDELRKKISENPYVAESLIKEGVQSLDIQIKERYPIAIVYDELGETHYTDNFAAIFPFRVFKEFGNLPIISGVFVNGKLDSLGLRGAISAINEMKKEENLYLYSAVSEIKYTANNKSYVLFDGETGTKIYLGGYDNLQNKIENLNKFYHYNATGAIRRAIAYIDARWNGEVVIKYQS